MNALLDYALAYGARGWPVLPLHTPRADGRCDCQVTDTIECTSRGKHPWTRRGLTDASADEATISRSWRRHRIANIGIRTGAPAIVAIDIDTPAAARALLDLAEGRPLGGLVIATGRGRQLWYIAPVADDVPTRNGWLGVAGLDVRGRGGYVVAPPSLHALGVLYRVAGGCLCPLPDFLYEELRQSPRRLVESAVAPPPLCEGNGTAFGRAVLHRECAELRATGEGRRNHKLYLVARRAGQLVAGGELGEDYARREITRAAIDARLGEREIVGHDGQGGTLGSGMRAGKAEPMTEDSAPTAVPEKRVRLILDDRNDDAVRA